LLVAGLPDFALLLNWQNAVFLCGFLTAMAALPNMAVHGGLVACWHRFVKARRLKSRLSGLVKKPLDGGSVIM
jgi:hypothetical protein